MASTFTTFLNLEKPGVGDQAETWGLTLNANFDAIDDAVDGTTPITPDINGGTIDGAAIGGATPAAGAFTTLSATGNVTVDTDTLFVDSVNDRVGVNTNAPTTALSLGGGGSPTVTWLTGAGAEALYMYGNTATNFFGIGNSTHGEPFTIDASANQIVYAKDLLPAADSLYDLGSNTVRWANGFFDALSSGSYVDVGARAATGGGAVARLWHNVDRFYIAPTDQAGNFDFASELTYIHGTGWRVEGDFSVTGNITADAVSAEITATGSGFPCFIGENTGSTVSFRWGTNSTGDLVFQQLASGAFDQTTIKYTVATDILDLYANGSVWASVRSGEVRVGNTSSASSQVNVQTNATGVSGFNFYDNAGEAQYFYFDANSNFGGIGRSSTPLDFIQFNHSAARTIIPTGTSLYPVDGVQLGGTAAANLLSDYEEGSWTPGITYGGSTAGVTYTARQGRYIKKGDEVTAYGYIDIATAGTTGGLARITDLPFTSLNVADLWYPSNLTISGAGLASTEVTVTAIVTQNATTASLQAQTTTGVGNLNNVDIPDLAVIRFVLIYRAA